MGKFLRAPECKQKEGERPSYSLNELFTTRRRRRTWGSQTLSRRSVGGKQFHKYGSLLVPSLEFLT